MAECPSSERLLQMLDEALRDVDQTEVAQHVDGCAHCQQLLEALTRYTPLPVWDGAAGPANLEADDPAQLLNRPRQPGELGRLAHYRVLELVGTGGMGVVFRAEDTRLQRLVALKVMAPKAARNPAARQRFLREARAAAAIRNDHVVTVYHVSEESEVPFLTMEFLEGCTLQQRLQREARLPLREVLSIGREAAQGLAAAHARGLIHRDIKPANLWLEAPTGRVKLLDFGLARAALEDSQLTHSGLVLGTPSYMVPEQARGERVDHRCDLFSLGCVLYRLSTGETPFRGSTTMAVLTALAVDRPKPPREHVAALPAALEQLLHRLLAKEPANRPASASEVVQVLQELEQSLAADTPSPPERATAATRLLPAAGTPRSSVRSGGHEHCSRCLPACSLPLSCCRSRTDRMVHTKTACRPRPQPRPRRPIAAHPLCSFATDNQLAISSR